MMADDATRPLRTSPTIAALAGALAKAQAAFAPLAKDKRADIQTRSGGTFTYGYVDLASVLAAIRGPLTANELAMVQAVNVRPHVVTVETTLLHASGEWIAAALDLAVAESADPRSVGSTITYARRFSVTALVGIAPADEDDDGAAAVPLPKARRLSTRTEAKSSTLVDKERDVTTPSRLPRLRADSDRTPLTEQQRKYLFAVAGEYHWPREQLKAMLGEAFGIESTKDLRATELEAALVRRGPQSVERQPGEEG
jgi:hypothetical protein